MDKHGKRFMADNDEPTKIIDIKQAEERASGADPAENGEIDEPTKVMRRVETSKKSKKEKKKDKDKNKEKEKEERLKEKNSKKLEKLMKKQKRREKKSDREVLSFEDMPLEEREEANKPEKKKRKPHIGRIIAVVLVLALLFSIVFVFANTDRFSWHNVKNFIKYGILNQKSDEQFPVSVQGENVDVGNFALMGQDICYASDTKLQIINNYGRFEYSAQHGLTNPILSVDKQYALIYSLGGNGYRINNYEQTIYEDETKERLLTGDIVDNGTYALVTTSDGYLSKMQVFDKNNEKIFGYSFADYYVTSVSLSPNGKSAVVSGLSALNGEEISAIYVLDFTKDKPVYIEEVEENIFYHIEYLNDTYACAVGSADASVINTKTGDIETTPYEGKRLTCYTVNKDTATFSVSLSRSGDGRNCEIISFKSDGEIDGSFETEYMVSYISTYKGRIVLLTPDVLYLYSKSGNHISDKEVSNEPRAVVLYTTSDAYVLDTSEISTMSI